MERIGVGFSGGMSPQDIVECVKVAEELGYESAWVAEGHGGDQFTILTACALATSRIKLGTSISSVFARSAPTIAIAAACVDEFSKGRFILGLGSSHRVQVVGEHGLAYGKPLTRVRESVEIIRALLRDGQVSYQGDIFNIEGYDLWFTPFRREIPVYLGAVNPRMLELCGRIAQGVSLTRSTGEQARAAIGHVSAGALGVGRDPDEVVRLPDPKTIVKLSTLYDQEGNVTQQWVAEKPDAIAQAEAWQEFAKALTEDLPRAEPVEPPETTASDLAACYPVGDHHMGMLAWPEETGTAWDLGIGERMLAGAVDYLVAKAPAAEAALIVFLGDFMHYDSFETVTPANKNQLDSDTRFPKLVRASIRAMRQMIERALEKHLHVHVI
ncbi:MAG: LLM class flavin-dependent oxidoreductase, partial [Chloroflexi bacterium]|nr:LLM class flavin-dependent oxidoreductase [Chloroflexota bacterium]